MKKRKLTPILPMPLYKPRLGIANLDDDARAKVIEQCLGLVWDSLHSHLSETYSRRADGGKKFQKRCVQEYAVLLHLISHLY